MSIQCPTCGCDTICVVEVTLVATGEPPCLPDSAVFLNPEGFCIPLPCELAGSLDYQRGSRVSGLRPAGFSR